MPTLLHQLARIDRKAALIFNREIKLRMKRRGLAFFHIPVLEWVDIDGLPCLVDSFNWNLTRQGYEFWEKVWEKC